MQIKVKLLSVGGVPASDGSIVPREVFESWLNSEEAKNAIASHKLLGACTHISRGKTGLKTNFNPAAANSIGREDNLLLVGNNTAPTHYIDNIWIDNDQWVWCTATILDEKVMDDEAVQNIKRLRGLLENGVYPGVSAVILGYWDSQQTGTDVLKKLVRMKGFDVTLNPSWTDASVEEIIPDGQEKTFSGKEDGGLMVKTFSDLSEFGDVAKSSKINGSFTKLKAKEFSMNGVTTIIEEKAPVLEEKLASEVETQPKEKEFSVATIRERVRYATKMSPRMRFRRLFLEYKQAIKQMGGADKMDPETLKVMKSLFLADINQIFSSLTQEILGGKQINTLTGASSLGKNVRVAAQKLQLPYRLAFQEMQKTGKLTPMRFQKIKEAYTEFAQSMVDEVFGSNPIPAELEQEIKEEENGKA